MPGSAQPNEDLVRKPELRVSTAPAELQDYLWVNNRLAEYDAKALVGSSPSHGATAIVAHFGGSHVAGVTYYERLGWTVIERLWVEPDYRRKGLGSILVNECELRAGESGHYGVRLTTTTGHQALNLYLALGFSIDARWPLNSGAGRHLEEIALSKRIEAPGFL